MTDTDFHLFCALFMASDPLKGDDLKGDEKNRCQGYEQAPETGMVRRCKLPIGHAGRHKHQVDHPNTVDNLT